MKARRFEDFKKLWSCMDWHVRREVKQYRDDFYSYNKELFDEYDRKREFTVLWATCTTGTWLSGTLDEGEDELWLSIHKPADGERMFRIVKEADTGYTLTKVY